MDDFNKRPRCYIISACKANLERYINKDRTEALARDLEQAGFAAIPIVGRFEGVTEDSFLVVAPANTADTVHAELLLLAQWYDQDSILLIAENDRAAYFVNPNTNHHAHAGSFERILINASLDLPYNKVDYSYINGEYWGVVKRGKLVDLPDGL